MTNEQLYLAIGVPMLFNALLTMVMLAYVNAKVDSVKTEVQLCETKITGRTDKMESALLNRMADLDIRMGKIENR